MVSALKAGEDRAIFLGLGMLVCSIVVAFLLGSRVVQSRKDSVWTEESTCTVLETRIANCKKCIHNCISKCWKPSEYPCVQIYVNLSSTGSRVLLHHTQESVHFNPECFCATKCSRNRSETERLIASITDNSTQFQPISFPCYYDPEGRQTNVLLTRFDLSKAVLHSSFWPTCIFLGGIVIIAMVKLTQYLSLLNEQSQVFSVWHFVTVLVEQKLSVRQNIKNKTRSESMFEMEMLACGLYPQSTHSPNKYTNAVDTD